MTRQPVTHLDRPRLDNLAEEIWKSAVRLRGKFKAHDYQNVILPIITIRRLECVLISWREKKAAEIRGKKKKITDKELGKLVKSLELNPRQSQFSNSTKWTMRKVYEEDHTLLEKNFRAYIKGFSENIQDIIENFNFRATIGRMVKNARLAPILNQYSTLDIGPEKLSSLEMGYIYEELLRRFSEQHAEAAGDHFTPREVIRLMVELLEIPIPDRHTSIYDPACGTGGMLYVAKEHLLDKAKTDNERDRVQKFVTLHGTELLDETYAICKSEALIRNENQATIHWGNSLIPHDPTSKEPGDQFPESKKGNHFDYMLSNPPFGVTWGGKDGYQKEAEKLMKTRYSAGMPSIDDGAFLFLQTMLAKMKNPKDGSSKIAIIFNGSPLSNGDCGQGENEIRRYILENNWLDAIVMLPGELFYNTGIFTYIWLLRNKRPSNRKGRIMLIDARKEFEKEPKSFGNKRNRITAEHREWIEERYRKGWNGDLDDDKVRFFKKEDFAYHKVSVVFWQTDENDKPAIITEPFPVQFSSTNVKKRQELFESEMTFDIALATPEGDSHQVRFALQPDDSFTKIYTAAAEKAFETEIDNITKGIETAKERNQIIKRFINALSKDVLFTHRHYIKEDEYIPYGEDISAFLEREIESEIIRWQDRPQLGYEILPNKYFYRYCPPLEADDLLKQFWVLEEQAEELLKGLGVQP